MSDPALSVVVPAYNETSRLEPTLSELAAYLDAHEPSCEVIVVDDGSTDDTADIARRFAERWDKLRVIQLEQNSGKGAAVRTGMLAARGAEVLFTDADLATPIGELPKLRAALADGNDIAIASRAVEGADIRVRQSALRELAGRGFNVFIRVLGMSAFKDTQCGFKLFTREAAHDLFARSTLDGFAFDVEVLMLARGTYEVAEVPVAWLHVEESKVSRLAGMRAFVDLARLRLRLRR